MRILLSNDDGYLAPGLQHLHDALASLGEITVVAPEQDRSGASNSLTLDRPLSIRRALNGFYFVNGTPTDCVHLAVTGMLEELPDMVVSGINHGANMGDDTIYSGTVGAAMEGYLFGIPAIAFSQVEKGWAHIDDAAQAAGDLVRRIGAQPAPRDQPWLLNVNIPNRPLAELKAPKVCRLGRRHAAQSAITMTSPYGETMYWIGGAGGALDASEGTDFHATAQGHLSLTPLSVDLTDHAALAYWAQGLGHLLAEGKP